MPPSYFTEHTELTHLTIHIEKAPSLHVVFLALLLSCPAMTALTLHMAEQSGDLKIPSELGRNLEKIWIVWGERAVPTYIRHS